MDRAVQLLIILVIEAAVGYPQVVYRAVRHPIVWVGVLIAAFELRWNVGSALRRRIYGSLLLLLLVSMAGSAGFGLEKAGEMSWSAMAFALLIGTTMLAQRSLHDHVAAVLKPLLAGDLDAARLAVARIVGRDTASLDAEGVSTAAIESLSESFCDGVVAPAFWFLVAGLPGLFICKVINTADSMVGHKDDRYRAFGWAVARADDLVNLLPARISGMLICVAGLWPAAASGLRTMFRDARLHASPNGGWPEAAMAGVLARQLGGPVTYDGEPAFRANLGSGPRPDAKSLRAALGVYWRACVMLWLIAGALAWLH